MFSVSPAEILTIAVVALLVFGPRRLPEIARKAGKVLRELREAAGELKSGMEAEYGEIVEPFRDVRDTMQQAITDADRRPQASPAPDEAAPAGADDASPTEEAPDPDEGPSAGGSP